MLVNTHLYARAQMTILKTEFLASQRSSTDSQCWVSKTVGARRMTLWTADWREVGDDRIGSAIMSKSETFQVSGDFFTHPQSVSTGHTKADPVTQKKKEKKKKWWRNYNNDNGEIRTGALRQWQIKAWQLEKQISLFFFLGEYIILLTWIYHRTFFKCTQNNKHKVSPKVE